MTTGKVVASVTLPKFNEDESEPLEIASVSADGKHVALLPNTEFIFVVNMATAKVHKIQAGISRFRAAVFGNGHMLYFSIGKCIVNVDVETWQHGFTETFRATEHVSCHRGEGDE